MEETIKRFYDKNSIGKSFPFEPTNAYDHQNIARVEYENYHPFIKELIDEHKKMTLVLNNFEMSLIDWRINDWEFKETINEKFKSFFTLIKEKVPIHNKKEDKVLLPLLNKKLIELCDQNFLNCELTGNDLIVDEHLKIEQAASIVFNLLDIGLSLFDKQSKEITFAAVFEQGLAIVETIKLHIYREENILFPQSMKLLNWNEITFQSSDILKELF